MRRLVPFTIAAVLTPFALLGCGGGENAFNPTPTNPKPDESRTETPPSSPASAALKQLEGTWTVVSQVYNGTPQFQPRGGMHLVICGSTYSRKALGESFEMGAIRVDPKQKPAALEFVPEVGHEKGRVVLCIYEQTGDEFRYCQRPSGGFRPSAFNADPGSGQEVVTLRRTPAK